MTPLEALIRDRIAAQGPLTVEAWMALALGHPEHGYYATRDPFGAAGDFVTAPEISQMFGELVGAWAAQAWADQGRPDRFVLAELGPGRGTLMRDALRAAAGMPGFRDAAELWLVETSPALRRLQAEMLAGAAPRWAAGVDALPDAPLFAIANEFFDALPIRQFERRGPGWSERMVSLRDGRLAPGLGPVTAYPALAHRLADTAEGDVVETCPAAEPVAGEIGRRVAQRGGAALFVDYGGWRSLGDTFQAVKDHAPADPFADPGETDLTAHVDFEPIAGTIAAAGAAVTALTPQGVFLERLGIAARAAILARGLSGTALAAHLAAHRRLTHPDEMGQLFKVLAAYPQGKAPPPGLDPAG